MILNELFDQAAQYNIGGDGVGEFQINGKGYIVDFLPFGDDMTGIEVSFGLQGKSGADHYGIEGTGDEIQVFATVVAMIRKYMSNKPFLTHIFFSAKMSEASRVKLYDRMVGRLLQGWKVDKRVRHGEIDYTITKPRTPQQQSSKEHEDVPY